MTAARALARGPVRRPRKRDLKESIDARLANATEGLRVLLRELSGRGLAEAREIRDALLRRTRRGSRRRLGGRRSRSGSRRRRAVRARDRAQLRRFSTRAESAQGAPDPRL